MAGPIDRSATDPILICRLVVTSGRRVFFSKEQTNHHVDSLDPTAISLLRHWDKARRAQGRPPTFEEVLEAFWVGFGCLRWLVDLSRFYTCAGCGRWITEADFSTHPDHCTCQTERQESHIPDPPEEVYLCPDEECGFWSTEYTAIRAPHPSKAHEEMHSSHSFILEDDPDVILELWMRRHPSRVEEVRRCRLCDAKFSSGRSAVEHFVKHHTTVYTGDDICGRLITGQDPAEKKALCDLICRTVAERNVRELVVVFSPSLQRVYRENIVSGRVPAGASGGLFGAEKWLEKSVNVIDRYFLAHSSPRSTVDVTRSSSRSPAQRISPGPPSGYSQVGSCTAVKICVPVLLRLLSGGIP